MDTNDIIQYILDHGIPLQEGSRDEVSRRISELLFCVTDYANHINRRNRKGWTPDELFARTPHKGKFVLTPGSAHMAELMRRSEDRLLAMGTGVDYSSLHDYDTLGEYGERRRVKVGRNDPCPCGSGKKYKKCHGRWD